MGARRLAAPHSASWILPFLHVLGIYYISYLMGVRAAQQKRSGKGRGDERRAHHGATDTQGEAKVVTSSCIENSVYIRLKHSVDRRGTLQRRRTVATAPRIRTSAPSLGGNLSASSRWSRAKREKQGCRDLCQVKLALGRFREVEIFSAFIRPPWQTSNSGEER